jgi:hypothetical protein
MKLSEIRISPAMQDFLVYRGMHVLCRLNRTMELEISHYCQCMIQGPSPMWGVWNATNGKFQHWFGSREEIEKAYPRLIWRRVMFRWGLDAIAKAPVAQRRAALEMHFDPTKRNRPSLEIAEDLAAEAAEKEKAKTRAERELEPREAAE